MKRKEKRDKQEEKRNADIKYFHTKKEKTRIAETEKKECPSPKRTPPFCRTHTSANKIQNHMMSKTNNKAKETDIRGAVGKQDGKIYSSRPFHRI